MSGWDGSGCGWDNTGYNLEEIEKIIADLYPTKVIQYIILDIVDTPPISPDEYDIYIDTDDNHYYKFNGSTWDDIGVVSVNDLVINLASVTQNIFKYNGISWIDEGTPLEGSLSILLNNKIDKITTYVYKDSEWFNSYSPGGFTVANIGNTYIEVKSLSDGNSYLVSESAPNYEALVDFRNASSRAWIFGNYGLDGLNAFNIRTDSFETAQFILLQNGNLGLKTINPLKLLSIDSLNIGTKISLYDNGEEDDIYGFGISAGQLNYHVQVPIADHVFYAEGYNGDGIELMRLKGSKALGIGVPDPTAFADIAAAIDSKASLRVRSGIAPTNPEIGDIWFDNEGLNFQYSATETKHFTPEDIIMVNSLADLPAKDVDDYIHLEEKMYVIHRRIDLVGPDYKGLYIDQGVSPTFLGLRSMRYLNQNATNDAFIKSANFGSALMIINDFLVVSDGTGRLYDVSSTDPSGIIIPHVFTAAGFYSLGTINDISYAGVIVNYPENVAVGLTLNDNSAIALQAHRFNDWYDLGATFVTITGTQQNIQINNNFFQPKSTEYALKIDSSLTTTGGSVVGNAFDLLSAGGTVFAPGSKDQGDIYWTYSGNSNLANSTVLMSATRVGNTETTVITSDNTYYPLTIQLDTLLSERIIQQVKITYDTQTGNFTVGQVVTGTNSSAYGTIVADDDQGTTGMLTVIEEVGYFEIGETITDPITGSATIANFYKDFKYVGLEDAILTVSTSATIDPVSAAATAFTVAVCKNLTPNEPGIDRKIGGGATEAIQVADTKIPVITNDEICTAIKRTVGSGDAVIISGRVSIGL